jgi:hypothetical protein
VKKFRRAWLRCCTLRLDQVCMRCCSFSWSSGGIGQIRRPG